MTDTIKALVQLSDSLWGDVRRLQMNAHRDPDTLSYQDVESSATALETTAKQLDRILAKYFKEHPAQMPTTLSRQIKMAMTYEQASARWRLPFLIV